MTACQESARRAATLAPGSEEEGEFCARLAASAQSFGRCTVCSRPAARPGRADLLVCGQCGAAAHAQGACARVLFAEAGQTPAAPCGDRSLRVYWWDSTPLLQAREEEELDAALKAAQAEGGGGARLGRREMVAASARAAIAAAGEVMQAWARTGHDPYALVGRTCELLVRGEASSRYAFVQAYAPDSGLHEVQLGRRPCAATTAPEGDDTGRECGGHRVWVRLRPLGPNSSPTARPAALLGPAPKGSQPWDAVVLTVMAGERVFCCCRRPDGPGTYVQCDMCGEWWHTQCAGLERDAAKKLPLWVCLPCYAAGWSGGRVPASVLEDSALVPPLPGEHDAYAEAWGLDAPPVGGTGSAPPAVSVRPQCRTCARVALARQLAREEEGHRALPHPPCITRRCVWRWRRAPPVGTQPRSSAGTASGRERTAPGALVWAFQPRTVDAGQASWLPSQHVSGAARTIMPARRLLRRHGDEVERRAVAACCRALTALTTHAEERVRPSPFALPQRLLLEARGAAPQAELAPAPRAVALERWASARALPFLHGQERVEAVAARCAAMWIQEGCGDALWRAAAVLRERVAGTSGAEENGFPEASAGQQSTLQAAYEALEFVARVVGAKMANAVATTQVTGARLDLDRSPAPHSAIPGRTLVAMVAGPSAAMGTGAVRLVLQRFAWHVGVSPALMRALFPPEDELTSTPEQPPRTFHRDGAPATTARSGALALLSLAVATGRGAARIKAEDVLRRVRRGEDVMAPALAGTARGGRRRSRRLVLAIPDRQGADAATATDSGTGSSAPSPAPAAPDAVGPARLSTGVGSLGGKVLSLGPSGIHGIGAFAAEHVPAGSLITEYVGEVLRPQVANVRQRRYEAAGVRGRALPCPCGCGVRGSRPLRATGDAVHPAPLPPTPQMDDYMFRLGQHWILDATVRGGKARFINHSCDPNCRTRVLRYGGGARIGIFSLRDIVPGEEVRAQTRLEQQAAWSGVHPSPTPSRAPFPRCCDPAAAGV